MTSRSGVFLAAGAVVIALLGASASATGSTATCVSPAGQAACALLPAAPFVTPEQARGAAVALWNVQERANQSRKVALFNGIDAGSALLEAHYTLASLACGCFKFYWTKGPRAVKNVTIYLPRQKAYPLYFLAEILAAPAGTGVPATGATADLILTRASPAHPWKIEMTLFDTGYDAPTRAVAPPVQDAAGYDTDAQSPPASTARKWPAMLAAYYNHLKNYGAPPATSRFLPGPLTTRTGLTNRRQGAVIGPTVNHYRFVVAGSRGAPWLLNLGGQTTACADILETETQTLAKPGTVFVQLRPHPSWGPDLPNGFYSKIITTWNWPTCISQQTNGLAVGGTTSGGHPVQTRGIRAHPAPGTIGIR